MAIHASIPPALQGKCETLEKVLAPYDLPAVAFSGGVDSTFLAWFLTRELEKEIVALFLVTPFLSRIERNGALGTARDLRLRLEELVLDPGAIPSVSENSTMRCYHCKKHMMARMLRRARELGCSVLFDGTHAGDKDQHRPGRKALDELGIVSPLASAQLLKPEIRELSRLAGLSTWNKPSQSCLATRVPYGTTLTREILSRIEQAEAYLWNLGCRQVRVRLHGQLARVEVDPDDFSLLLESATRMGLYHHLLKLGFRYVSLDLKGYRSGSWDEPANPESSDAVEP